MFEVYHAKQPLFGFGPEQSFPADYEKVAEVEVKNNPDLPAAVEEVYFLTNHVDRDWTTNPGVKAIGNRHRSTSVGDVVINTTTGEKLRVGSFGWDKIS
jgi:hypothetical protein